MTNAPEVPKPPLKDRLIPWYFVMAFAVVFAVNGVFVYVAMESNSGVVTENPYEKGLEYDRTLAKAREQQALGWQTGLDYTAPMLSFTLADKQGAPLEKAIVTATIERPVADRYRSKWQLLWAPEAGHYQKEIHFPLPGQWDVTIDVLWNQQHYQHRQRLVVNQSSRQ